MTIRCECQSCSTRFKVDAAWAGKKARCPKCRAVFLVPTEPPDEGGAAVSASPTSVPEHDTASPKLSPTVSAEFDTTAVRNAQPAAGPEFAKTTPDANPKATKMAAPLAIPVAAPPSPKAIPVADLPQSYVADVPVARPIDAPTATFNNIQVRAEPALSRTRAQRGSGRREWLVWAGGLGLLTACLGTLSWLGLWLATRTEPQAVVVVDLSPAFRHESAVLVDGERQELPVAGPVELRLIPGTHQLTVRRRGFEPVTTTLELTRRQRLQFQPQWKRLRVDAEEAPVAPAENPVPLDPEADGGATNVSPPDPLHDA